MKERKTWFFAAIARSSVSKPYSLRAAGSLERFREADAAGHGGVDHLVERAKAAGIEHHRGFRGVRADVPMDEAISPGERVRGGGGIRRRQAIRY